MTSENIVEIILACITAVTALSTTVITTIFSRRQKRLEKRQMEDTAGLREMHAVKSGVRTILWAFLNRIYCDSMQRGFVSVEDLRLADGLYGDYHALGGNGTGTAVYEKLLNMPNKSKM